ncbi:hypothetical protein [Wenyingzhuangia sp. 2_MG-2023]|uniref:hypothetical protein n=1 Tax=Wenyingzhuangia sp. 2_MG-2023 TaxID=3062639 RepID=UPI0026E385A9|nr:hypothetical protein [Wenyingzhuangia sp. 2_MG-2023]MDO6737911.1 hypothetical protein [Wenyingzhuangia sp. 2_MG-2023]
MRKILLVLSFSFFLTGCEFKEELYLKKNGKGTLLFEVDSGKMLAAMGNIGDHKNTSNAVEKKVDTLIYFKDIINKAKDSIKKLDPDDQKIINALKNFTLKIYVDPSENNSLFSLNNSFENINQVQDLQNLFQTAGSLYKNSSKPKTPIKYQIGYELNKKKIRRFVIEKKLSKEDESLYQKSIEQGKMIYIQSNYRLVYHFENKIKNSTLTNAFISEDKKTLEIKYPMDTLVSNPYLLEFEVTFK